MPVETNTAVSGALIRMSRRLARFFRGPAIVAIGLFASTAMAAAHVTGQSVQPPPSWLSLVAVGAGIVLALAGGAYFLGQKLTEKPWLPAQGLMDNHHAGNTFTLPTAMLGLRVLLAVGVVLFSLFSVAYISRMEFADWRSMPEPWLMWLNTGFLVLSSGAMQWARTGAARSRMDDVRIGLLVGGFFAFAFLAGQLLVWRQLSALGYYAASNPAYGFFYMITALHGVHLIGGLVALTRTTARAWSGVDVGRMRSGVELCTYYWHFLLLVWLIIFVLLLFT